MKIYFDSEFTGLNKNDDLISIGLICSTPDSDNIKYRSFYGVISDFDSNKCDPWVLENVIKQISTDNLTPLHGKLWLNKGSVQQNRVYGTFEFVSAALNNWLKTMYDINAPFVENPALHYVEFVSDVSSYDFVHLVDLITMHQSSLDLPTYIVPYCIDIMPTIKKFLPTVGCADSWYHAFNENRENMLREIILHAEELKKSEKMTKNEEKYCSSVGDVTDFLVSLWDPALTVNKYVPHKLGKWNDILTRYTPKHNALFDATVIYAIELLSKTFPK